jgi:Neuraminidase (sialidase)
MSPLRRLLFVAATGIVVAGCGGGGGSAPPASLPPPAPPPVVFPPAPAAWRVSGTAAFAADCDGVAPTGTLYPEAEVEPHVAVSPQNPLRLIGGWQQNRWSDGASQGLLSAYSVDGGASWQTSRPRFTRCTGGTIGNGGDYQRASDPWIAISPDGTAYFMALAVNGASFAAGSANAMLVARSTDGGATWSAPTTLIRDGASAFNDKNTMTADPLDARFVYAVWDRIAGARGPTVFTRTTDGGATWEAARAIRDPGDNAQTIGNVIAVVPAGAQAGTLVNLFTEIVGNTPTLRVIRSGDRGVNWSAPITVAALQSIGAKDPTTGAAIRDGSDLAQIAAAPNGDLVVVWQDARFASGQVDAIAFARSTDGGLNWTAPRRVSPAQTAAAFTPQVAVRADGAIAVSYYDLRDDTSDASTLPTSAWLAVSRDAGATWSEQRLSGPFDLLAAPNARGLFLGDYQGLVASGSAFVPFYVQTTGTGAANRTDVFAGRVAAASASAARASAVAPPAVPDFSAAVKSNVERQRAWRIAGRQPGVAAAGR